MIQFLFTEEFKGTAESMVIEALEKSFSIFKCINMLIQKSESVPLASNETVQEFYFTLWLHEIFTELRDAEKMEILKQIFIQSENLWKQVSSAMFEDLKKERKKYWHL